MTDQSDDANAEKTSFADLLKEGRALLTLTLVIAIGSHAINIFAVRTVLPTIVADIGGAKILFWSTALFSLMAILGGMLTINLKSSIGARQSFYLAAILLVIGSGIGGFAPIFEVIIIGRGIQGFAEGILVSLAYMVLADSYKGNLMTRMIGILAIVWALAAAIGPMAAGILEHFFTWRGTFLVNFVIGLVIAVQAFFAVPDTKRLGAATKPDMRVLLPLILAITILCFIGQFTDPLPIAALLIAAAGLVFIGLRAERHSKRRMLPLRLFDPRSPVAIAYMVTLLVNVLNTANALYNVAFVQTLWNIDLTLAGYMTALPAAFWTVGSWSVSGVSTYPAQRRWIIIGIYAIWLSVALSAIALKLASLPLFLLSLTLLGLGLGWQNIFIEKIAVQFVRGRERDRAAAMLPPMDNAASAFGAALAGLVALNIALINPDAPNGLFTADGVQSSAPLMSVLFFVLHTPMLGLPHILPKTPPRKIT
ncbi:putative multidrug-efflux transporter [Maritalea myrionectae]|uniref:Putative multidrug-efflux transporter n=1 Tax=Maritalea myrionectae TaxID=454601 RepID=A0A2R4MDE0_9HYPH|nr:MFS transporter [Maritalea myrionectae]AVX03889.1 putative multidrug-efflux transporter [Maritalea myrionectae]